MTATAADFSPYVDANEAARLAAEHNAQVALPSGGGPPVALGQPVAAATAPAAAQAEIDKITADRASGKISGYDWRTIHEPRLQQLIPLAASAAHGPLDGAAGDTYEAPRSTSQYHFPQPPERGFSAEEAAGNAAVADAALASGIPPWVLNNALEDASRFARELQKMLPDDAEVHVDRHVADVRAGLSSMWGEANLKTNMETIEAYLNDFCRKHPKAAPAVTGSLAGLSAGNFASLHTWIVSNGGAR